MAYSDEDLNSAVAAGVITPEAVTAFRSHIAEQRHMPRGDEENFRLINSFNDIFVAIGVVIMLVAVGSIGGILVGSIKPNTMWTVSFVGGLPTAMVAITAWFLAEVFTRKRRMALPSIILLLTFVGAAFFLALSIIALPFGLIFGPSDFAEARQVGWKPDETTFAILIVVVLSLTAAATTALTWFHWRRFSVPITVAAGVAALVATFVAIVQITGAVVTDGEPITISELVLFVAGLAVFAFAMRWDMSDRARITRRSDVAFWLHMLAAPIIAHTVFSGIGLTGSGATGMVGALGVLVVYAIFGIVALIIDRRALLVSALAYVLFALTFLFNRFGAVELNFALTALVIGSALLTLSAFWSPIRSAIVTRLPSGWQQRLPAIAND